MSFVYPILLALLILGALFVPFIALFFFLAVSAFNCSGAGAGGLGSGFSQVTPVFGRRRRRRRSLPAGSDGGGKSVHELASAFARELLGDFEQYLGVEYATLSEQRDNSKDGQDATMNLIATKLPLSMLFDSLEFIFGGDDDGERKRASRELNERGRERGTRRAACAKDLSTRDSRRGRRVALNQESRFHLAAQSEQQQSLTKNYKLDEQRLRKNETRAAASSQLAQQAIRWVPASGPLNDTKWNWWNDDYKTWQQKLAVSTVLLRNALVKFIDY